MNPPPWQRLMQMALLDFERTPGRYPVALREPRPLFEHIDSVILLASERPVAGLQATPAAEHALRRAARHFVRTVMLRPGADAFTVLGLAPGFEPAQLRVHHRLMIRLTHPDFGAAGEIWPADAATRVNRARDLLSSAPAQGRHGLISAATTPTAAAAASALPLFGRLRRSSHPNR